MNTPARDHSDWRRERWLLLLLVFIGGCIGACVRAELTEHFAPAAGGWPWVTFWINIGGAALLGVLLGALAGWGSDTGLRRRLRLGVGTGVLGGFTTYSTFAVEVVERQRDSLTALSLGYAASSVAGGVVAAMVGLLIGRTVVRR